MRTNLELKWYQTMYIYVGEKLINQEKSMGELYDKYKDEDGFLYFSITVMDAFG